MQVIIDLFLFFHYRLIDGKSNSHRHQEIRKYFWKLPSSLLILFYSSMVLAQLLASSKKYIETFHDLANAQVVTVTAINSPHEVAIRVNIRLKFH